MLPAQYVAETVKAMGEVQDKALQGAKVLEVSFGATGARFGLIHPANLRL